MAWYWIYSAQMSPERDRAVIDFFERVRAALPAV